ncbi:MAG: DUF2079 domain-containing protein [Fuerstiella sp.]
MGQNLNSFERSFPTWAMASVLGIAALSASICGWLTEPVCFGVLWPEDINSKIVQMLGGETSISLSGKSQVDLPWYLVWIRIASVVGLSCVLGGWCSRKQSSERWGLVANFLRSVTLIFGSSCVWWGLWLIADLGMLKVGELALGLLPLWFMATMGVFIWLVGRFLLACGMHRGSTEVPRISTKRSSGLPWLILCLASLGWVGFSYWLNQALYDQLMIPHGDSAMYEEHLWNVWHGKGFRSYLDQGLFLGEHIQVIHLLLLPLHFFWSSHLLLELSESVALASCSLFIFAMTKRHTGSSVAAMWMGLAWLCYFPMHFLDIAIDQKTFRPIALGLPFLFGMIYYGEQRQIGKTAVCLLIALSAKEDVALIACPVLAVIAARVRADDACRDEQTAAWKHLLALSIATAIYLVVTVLVIIPAFRSGEHVHYARYFGSLGNTPGELIRTALRDPLAVISQALSVQTVVYVAVFLVPLALLPVRRLWVLSAGVITFGMLSLLQFSTDAADLPPVPYHHFHAPLLPVIFWAGICALSGLGMFAKASSNDDQASCVRPSRFPAGDVSALIFCCCLMTSVTGSLSPLGTTFWSDTSKFGYHQLYNPVDERRQERADSIGAIVEQIPVTARVASTDYVHTRLTHHERSYDYSGYLRAVNNYQPGVPADTDFIVLDVAHPYSQIRSASEVPELSDPENGWRLREDLSNACFLVLERQFVEPKNQR